MSSSILAQLTNLPQQFAAQVHAFADLQLPIHLPEIGHSSSSAGPGAAEIDPRQLEIQNAVQALRELYRSQDRNSGILYSILDASALNRPDTPLALYALSPEARVAVQRQAAEMLMENHRGNPPRSFASLMSHHMDALLRSGNTHAAEGLARFLVEGGDSLRGELYGNIDVREFSTTAQSTITAAQLEGIRQGIESEGFSNLILFANIRGRSGIDAQMSSFLSSLSLRSSSSDPLIANQAIEALQLIASDPSASQLYGGSASVETRSRFEDSLLAVARTHSDPRMRAVALEALSLLPSQRTNEFALTILRDSNQPIGMRLSALTYFNQVRDNGVSLGGQLRDVLQDLSQLPSGSLRAGARQLLTLQAAQYINQTSILGENERRDAFELADTCLTYALTDARPLDSSLINTVVSRSLTTFTIPLMRAASDPHGSFSEAFDRGLWNALREAETDEDRLTILESVISGGATARGNSHPQFSGEQLQTLLSHLENLGLALESDVGRRDRLVQRVEGMQEALRVRQMIENRMRNAEPSTP